MQHRNFQLAQVNSDLNNLLASVNIAILMLGSDLSIRRFTPKAEEVLGLRAPDVGRLLVQVKLRIDISECEHMMLQVMRDGKVREHEFRDAATVYRLRLSPYRTAEDSIQGLVAVFFDVTHLGNAQLARKGHKKSA
jgi:two-component system CheB/CheR fusion protein